MMKQLFKTVSITFLIMIFIFGCNKLEEHPLSIVTPANAYKNYSDLYLATIGMFAVMTRDDGWQGGFNITQYMTSMYGSDDLTCNPTQGKAFMDFDEFQPALSNGNNPVLYLDVLWRSCYRTIVNANAIIENYPNTTGNKDSINNLAGQAYFCRALCYFYLVRLWGDIPLYTSSNVDVLISKSPVSSVYNQIISDFKVAEQLVPVAQKSIGMAKRGAVKAFLAKAYLTKAGWPVKDAGSYALAAAKAKEVIDSSSNFGIGLMPDCASLWKRANDNNIEEIFSVQCDIQDPNNGDPHGLHIIGAASLPDELGGWDDFFPELTFFKEFPAGPRKDATFITFALKNNGDTIIWQNFITTHPYYAKFRDLGVYGSAYSSAAAYALMRYPDVLLIYAEAKAQATGNPDASAYAAINQVRNRAGLLNLTAGLSTAAFVDSVIAERGWELAGEGQRWFDLIRTEKVKEVMDKRDASEQVKLIGDYTNTANWYAPIPATDVTQDPNLK